MATLKVKSWAKYQHYKDRCPPWIKLATNTFQDYDFSRLHDASKLLAVCIWTLASRSQDGSVPHDFEYIKSQCCLGQLIEEMHLTELISNGFLYASDTLAECTQVASPEERRDRGETETESASVLGKCKVLADSDCGIVIARLLNFSGIKLPREIAEACPIIREALGFSDNNQLVDFLPAKWKAYQESTQAKYRMKFETWLSNAKWKDGEIPRVNGQLPKEETPYERTQRQLREPLEAN